MFVRPKTTIDGKKRRYLVESYRDKTTRKPRQRHIAYVDLWPKKDIARLIRMVKKCRDALVNSERPENTKAYKRVALDKAVTLDKAIKKFKRDMRVKLVPSRNKVDRRRLDADTGIRHLQNARIPVNPFCESISLLMRAASNIRELENKAKMIAWPDDKLDSFIAFSKFIHDKHEEALRLLNAKTMK
jgi:hypothetical protein